MEVQLGREDIRFTTDSGEKRKASLLVSEESRGIIGGVGSIVKRNQVMLRGRLWSWMELTQVLTSAEAKC